MGKYDSVHRVRVLRTVLLVGVSLGLVMIAGRVALDPQVLGMPWGLQTTIAAAVMLVGTAFVVSGSPLREATPTWRSSGTQP